MILRKRIAFMEGDTWAFVARVRDAAGAPYPLAGLVAHLQLRVDASSAPFATLSSATSGIAMNSPTAGDMRVTVPSTATRGICRRGAQLVISTELELRDGSTPPVVLSVAPLEIVVEPEGTRV